MNVLERKLVLVAGKGGVGRTTLTAALALAAGLQGKRSAAIELYGADSIPPRFGMPGRSFSPRAIAHGVDTFSLTPYECLDDFGRQKLKINALVRLLFHNPVFRAFIDAVPGMHDMFQLGKINHLATTPAADDPRYDLIVLDAPATGHGLTLLMAAASMRETVGGGLVADEADLIRDLLQDAERSGIVLVTLPDDLPVNESLDLVDQLGDHRHLLACVIVNQSSTLVLPDEPWEPVDQALRTHDASDIADFGASVIQAAQRERGALKRLERGLTSRGLGHVPIVRVPRISPHELRSSDHTTLAQTLLRHLDGTP